LGGVFEAASSSEPCLALLREAHTLPSTHAPLVIMHSFLGDESGYERLWKLHFKDRAVYAVRHRFLAHADADEESTPLSAAAMLEEYVAAILSTLGDAPFDLIGASYGSLVAQHLAHAARAAGAHPRRLVLIDPFPFWPRIRETAPMSALLSANDGGQDARSAAHFILKLRLQSQLGAERGDARLAELIDELANVPNDAVGLFLAAQALPADASREELLVQALRERRRVLAVSSVGPTIVDLVESLTPFRAPSGEPAVLMVLASERKAFFDEVYGTTELSDAFVPYETSIDLYSPAVEPIRVNGPHFDVVTRCISNRVPDFTSALEKFLSEPVAPPPAEATPEDSA
jgi:thioesterase domain-containing protein